MRPLQQLLITAVVLSLVLILIGCRSGRETSGRESDTVAQVESEKQDSLVIDLTGIDSSTVLALLVSSHRVDYRNTIAGAFVIAIDSVRNSSAYFWLYTVNDSMPPTACDKYVTHRGDRVRWHFRKVGQ